MPTLERVEGKLTKVTFRVHGIPATQGSMRAFLPKGGKFPIVTHDNKAPLRSWRDAVASEALRKRRGEGLITGPIALRLRFYLPQPRSRPAVLRTDRQRREWAHHWKRPDIDKLQRAVLDALKGVLYHDDGQIVQVMANKSYSATPGLEIQLECLT